MSINYREIGIRLKQARGKTSQKGLAEEFNLSNSYISNIENGAKPSLEYLTNIASQFNISLDWLVFGIGSMHGKLECENLQRKELLQIFDSLSPDKQAILLGTIKTILDNSSVTMLSNSINRDSTSEKGIND